jgi:putative transposase
VGQNRPARERPERTAQGCCRFRCRSCGKQSNERIGTVLNRAQYPADVIALVVLWRLCHQLSLRDLAEMFLARGLAFSHEAVRSWEAKLTPTLAEELRRRRRGRIGKSWYVDETYLRVGGRWCYLYRAVDRNGDLVDVRLSERRDLEAARAFFRSARTVTGVTPARVTTDGHDSYPRAIRSELGRGVRHRTSVSLPRRNGSPALSVQLTLDGSGQGIEVPRLCRFHAPPRSRTDCRRGASPKLPPFSAGSRPSHCFTCTKSAGEPAEWTGR